MAASGGGAAGASGPDATEVFCYLCGKEFPLRRWHQHDQSCVKTAWGLFNATPKHLGWSHLPPRPGVLCEEGNGVTLREQNAAARDTFRHLAPLISRTQDSPSEVEHKR